MSSGSGETLDRGSPPALPRGTVAYAPRAMARASARRRVGFAIMRRMRRAADLIVEVLDAEPRGLSTSELARRVGRHDGNVRRVLAQLREAGLVQRAPGPGREARWYRTGRPAPPPPPPAPRPVTLSLLVRPELYHRLEQQARRSGQSISETVRQALDRSLNDQQETETRCA